MTACPIKTIRFTEQAKWQLVTIKKRTQIATYNVIARWAFCLSLGQNHSPSPIRLRKDSNLEMSWETFAGPTQECLWLALIQYCRDQGLSLENEDLINQFDLHLHRGIGYLSDYHNYKVLEDLIKLAFVSEWESLLTRSDTPDP